MAPGTDPGTAFTAPKLQPYRGAELDAGDTLRAAVQRRSVSQRP